MYFVDRMLPDQKWAQCDNPKCLKWRLLPDATDLDSLPDKWYCKDHPLEQWRSCDIPEKLEEEKDTATAQPYAKEVTKQLYVALLLSLFSYHYNIAFFSSNFPVISNAKFYLSVPIKSNSLLKSCKI